MTDKKPFNWDLVFPHGEPLPERQVMPPVGMAIDGAPHDPRVLVVEHWAAEKRFASHPAEERCAICLLSPLAARII